MPGYWRRTPKAPLTIADIALEVGVSVRALQAGFREWRQTTPCRAAAIPCKVRARLRNPTKRPVTGRGAAVGFAHLGRFSASYKAIFDETPGSTLRRRRSRAVERR